VSTNIAMWDPLLGTDLALKSQLDGDSDTTEKSELVKYAEVLKDSHGGTPRLHRRSASLSFF